MRRNVSRLGIVLMVAVTAACRGGSEDAPGEPYGFERNDAQDEPAKGRHGGRLLREGDLAVEVTIYERGVPPEFRVYAYDGDQPVDPDQVKLAMTLRRFGGRVDTFRFAKREDYLLGDATVEEPHSFDVEVSAEHRGRTARWTYPSYEGRTEMSPAAIASSEIRVATVGPASIRTTVRANGRIVPNAERLAHIVPRYAGVVRDVRARLGDLVTAGQVLAVVESNQSLQPYEVRSAVAGAVVAKDALVGEQAREGDVIFTIADLGTVWADLSLPTQDARRVRIGQSATVASSQDDTMTADGRVTYLSPIGTASTQTLPVRVELANAERNWIPGLYVTAEILVEEITVPTAVKANALQTFRDWDVVFLNEGAVFQAMPVKIGRRDSEWVEVLGGVVANQSYVTDNSFIVKADVGKSGATHDH